MAADIMNAPDLNCPPNDGAAKLLEEAQEALGYRRWSDAIEIYAKYVRLCPENAEAWASYADALRESGMLDEAEAAYKRSLFLVPTAAGIHLRLGRLYKLKRSFSGAIASYREALRIDGTVIEARRELEAIEISVRDAGYAKPAGLARKAAIYLDLSDVFFYLRHHPTVSGIQRVQLGIAKALIELDSEERSGILFLTETFDRKGYIIVEDVFITELLRALSWDKVEHERLLDIMRSAISLGQIYEPASGDTLLILGAFWVMEDVADLVALSRKGVRIGTLIHDIIPIIHPEYCVKSLSDSFSSCFLSVVSIADFILTVSDYTRRCVQEFLSKSGLPSVPVRTLKLAHKTWEPPAEPVASSPAIAQLVKEDHVLYVSTVEVRKNHTYLFRIWKRLIEQRGEKNVPQLIFVGREGWRVQDLMDQLHSTANLNGRIKIIHGLSDAELAALYRSALFTVFPSFEEGWGLPVGESLMFGRPCLAASTSSVPEVAGEFADYIDPHNINDGYEKILRFIDDSAYREQRAEHLSANFIPRTWNSVAVDLVDAVKSLLEDPAVEKRVAPLPVLKPGRRYQFGHGNDFANFIDTGDSHVVTFGFDRQWYPVEDFGRWMKGGAARLEFCTEQTADGPLLIMLETTVVPWLRGTQLEVSVNGASCASIDLKASFGQLLLLETAALDGKVALAFRLLGPIAEGNDTRKDLCLGLRSLAYAPSSDLLARLSLFEELVISTQKVTRLRPVSA